MQNQTSPAEKMKEALSLIPANAAAGFNILYVLRQASMPFFKMGSYPIYKMEDGNPVHDTSDCAKKFQRDMLELQELMVQVSSRVERNMPIPKTWLKKLRVEGRTAVTVGRERSALFKEWTDAFDTAMTFLESYKPSTPH